MAAWNSIWKSEAETVYEICNKRWMFHMAITVLKSWSIVIAHGVCQHHAKTLTFNCFFIDNDTRSFCRQCRSRSDCTFCAVWSLICTVRIFSLDYNLNVSSSCSGSVFLANEKVWFIYLVVKELIKLVITVDIYFKIRQVVNYGQVDNYRQVVIYQKGNLYEKSRYQKSIWKKGFFFLSGNSVWKSSNHSQVLAQKCDALADYCFIILHWPSVAKPW